MVPSTPASFSMISVCWPTLSFTMSRHSPWPYIPLYSSTLHLTPPKRLQDFFSLPLTSNRLMETYIRIMKVPQPLTPPAKRGLPNVISEINHLWKTKTALGAKFTAPHPHISAQLSVNKRTNFMAKTAAFFTPSVTKSTAAASLSQFSDDVQIIQDKSAALTDLTALGYVPASNAPQYEIVEFLDLPSMLFHLQHDWLWSGSLALQPVKHVHPQKKRPFRAKRNPGIG